MAAWLLATSPERSLRNGDEAVELARRAVRLAGDRDPALLGTLAASYAEAGRFAEAVAAAQRALDAATARGNAALCETLRARIKLYQSGTPLRDAR